MEEALKKCMHNGCKKQYKESENTAEACHFHPGKPMFHDTKKGWTCCNTVVYDWDEFQKIQPCAVGQHSDIDPNQNLVNQQQFFQSSTVSNAANAIKKDEIRQDQIKSISKYNQEQDRQKQLKDQEEICKPKKIFVTPSGKYKCINKGCNKEYDPNDNTETSCSFHPGQPIFHDLKKYWSCCTKETYDWDEFQKLPTCKQGRHEPKIVTL